MIFISAIVRQSQGLKSPSLSRGLRGVKAPLFHNFFVALRRG
jgi:hypothetical protein